MVTGRRTKSKLCCLAAIMLLLFNSCNNKSIADITIDVPGNNWLYSTKAAATLEITDTNKPYNIFFNLRITSEYKYSNIYILFKMKDPSGRQTIKRFGYKVAEQDGQWTGNGSGNIYAYRLPVMSKYKFGTPGKYQLVIEQNMRDNPLRGISDVGLSVEADDVE